MKTQGEGGWKKRTLVWVITLGLAFSVWPTGLVSADKKSELEEKLDNVQKDKAQQEKDITELQKEIDDFKSKLNELEEDLEKAKREEEKKKKKLKEATEELNQYDDRYKNGVRSMYINGGGNQMQILLESESFGQFLARFEVLRLIVKKDYEDVKQYYDKKAKAEKAQKEVKKARKKVEKKTKKARKEYDKMVALMDANQEKLQSLKSEEGDYRKELEKLKLERIQKESPQTSGSISNQGPLMRPAGGRISSGYGYRGSEFHTGIDFAAGQGSPIYAAGSGRVIRAQSCSCGYGYYIIIDHGGGIYTLYAHMYSWQSRVSVGSVVQKGQQIAAIGNNGRSTGPHLHFEVHQGRPGNHVNPNNYMR